MEIRTYKHALNYLESFISPIIFKRIEDDVDFDPLDRMRTLLGLIGNPEKKFKSVLVTGTSGKGSTAYLISHVLEIAGYKVGLTISPHLQKVNERLQINNQQISDDKFINLLKASILPSIERMSKMKVGRPSYFEILIALAFLYFSEQKVDIAVVEVGIEGKYDATNTLNPLMVVLTNISLDHTQILGDTVEKIAGEAVGAIKKFPISNLVVVTGVRQKSVIKIVEEKCGEAGAKLFRLGKDFDDSIIKNYELSLLGDYQKENASLAVEAVRQLADFGFNVSEQNIRQALSTAFFPGRFEIVRGPVGLHPRPTSSLASLRSGARRGSPAPATPLIILDGAHNPAKMKAFISSLQKTFPKNKKIFIVAFKSDKNIKAMLEEILSVADVIIATRFSMATDVSLYASADAVKIKNQISSLRQGFGRQANFKSGMKVTVEENSKKALNKALAIQQYNNQAIIIVTSSLYLVGEIRSLIYRD